ncbi:MAG: aminotransferase class I/II-fold pyridoxal phosphate-dependent enzyme, partial [Lachnospiraceae bacterium]|nr:aminotransferase class I/II-fold pyridoxal phosphate-dependent enzyme [Lachnospiraceae bacterium]
KLSDPKVRLMILCNPQNPSGMLWDAAVLARVGELCEKHGVTVISDEIHCDLTAPGYEYTPFASVSDVCLNNSITCIAPTKAFNIAGVHSSAVMISDTKLKNRIRKGLRRDQLAEPGSLSVDAAIAAFNEGEEWLDALREYIEENKRIFREFVLKELPEISVVKGNATYLLWLDFSNIVRGNEDIAEEIRKTTGLFMSTGSIYGNAGKKFARINLACPRSTLHQGMQRLKEGVRNYWNGP